MEDWDSEDFQPVAPVVKVEPLKNQWADEDVDADDVKDSWEEEEEEEKPKPAAVQKNATKPSAKAPAKKGKQQASTSAEEPDEPLSPTSEKIRQQRLVEEADFKSTTDLFAKKSGEQKSLDTFIPKSESDFAEYAELIANKLLPYDKSFHYMALLKNVMRLSMTPLKGSDAKDISSSVTAIANEKIKAEKEAAAGKKKQGARKKQLHIEKGDDDFIPGRGGGYDDPDEYDFM
ncbi:eukaryotic translation initiation factor 3 subunit 1 alpha, 35kDa [Zea mays]|uniref:Eukaryotic translation initiation factor 3 subunit J n=1 Tax=Zea mays TaxID=4577 RepID=B4FUX6_MAIZE|nr:eukaryotic translation initiation factor 3 subunit 1 alpha, 35kDa [Zea mays]ACF85919.1 unknown [Zea mays]AQK67969.1 Translation initiation factor eIF3 subunit [Zea mays]